MDKNITIAVDGLSGTGKSTLARSLAKELGYVYIDTGAMYRAVTLYTLRQNVTIEDSKVAPLLSRINITFKQNGEEQLTQLNEEVVESEIRKLNVSSKVSAVAACSSVRQFLVRQQRELGKEGGVVMDGRDIGTVVFPQAQLKLFVIADVDIRAQRRWEELRGLEEEVTLEEVRKNLSQRDEIDTTRNDSPLIKAEDAIEINTSGITKEQQLQKALELAKAAMR